MKRLVLELAPAEMAALLTSQVSQAISGTRVYGAGLTRALLQHGSYDAYYAILDHVAAARICSTEQPVGRTVRPLSAQDAASLAPGDHVVLLTDRPILNSLASFRRRLGHHYPIVGVIHAVGGDEAQLVRMILDRQLCHHDAIICSTQSGRRAWEQTIDGLCNALDEQWGIKATLPIHYEVIPLGIDVDQFSLGEIRAEARQALGVPGQSVALLYFGRLSALYKGDLLPLLMLCADLRATGRDIVAIVAGDDSEEGIADSLLQAAAELGLQAHLRVVVRPSEEEKLRCFAAADIFVSPSDNLQETFGIALAEAMAAGLPIVASDWDGYRDVVVSGETGFLIPTAMPRFGHDRRGLEGTAYPYLGAEALAQTTIVDVEAMATAVQTLVDNPDLRTLMGQAARERAKRFYDWSVVVRSYEALWANLTERSRQCGATERRSAFDPVPYQHAFGHYASRFLEDTDVVELAPRDLPQANSAVGRSIVGGRFDPSIFAESLSIAAVSGHLTVGELSHRLAVSPRTLPVVRAHIARLIKYGILHIRH